MRVFVYVGFMNWWGSYPPDVLEREDCGALGGGEQCALRTSFGLAALGHEVTYESVAQPGVYQSVRFVPQDRAIQTFCADGPWDAVVSWSAPHVLRWAQDGEARVLAQQLNDLIIWDRWWEYVDVVAGASPHHTEALRGWAPAHAKDACAWTCIPNGVDPALFPETVVKPPDQRPMWVGHWSSPDRALFHLLDAWPAIHREVPTAKLRVYYKVQGFIDTVLRDTYDGMQLQGSFGRSNYVAILLRDSIARCRPIGLDLIDAVHRRVLARDQLQCRVMAYPLDADGYTEGFGQSVPEAMMAGCLPVVRCVDAFSELWVDGCWNITSDPTSSAFHDEIVAKVVRGLTEWDGTADPSQADLRRIASVWTWDRSAAALENAILLAQRHRQARDAA